MLHYQRSSLWKWIELLTAEWEGEALCANVTQLCVSALFHPTAALFQPSCGKTQTVGTVRHGGGRDLSAFRGWVNENTLTSSHHEQRFLEVFCFFCFFKRPNWRYNRAVVQKDGRPVPVGVYSLQTWTWNQQYHWSKWWRCRRLQPAPSPLVSAALLLNCTQTHRWGNTSS